MPTWIHTFFKNISQVVLLENSWTGLIILIALWIGNWKIGLAAMVGSLLSLLTARFFNYTEAEIQAGLAGFNPVLIAIDLTLFLVWSWQNVMIILICILLAMPIAQAIKNFLKPFHLPELTTPFVVLTWIVLLMSRQFKFIQTNVAVLPLTSHIHIDLNTPFHPVLAFFNNVSQIFLIEHVLSGLLIVIACWIASRRAGLYILVANLLGLLLEFFLGADIGSLNEGLFGFNLMLTIIAIGVTFRSENYFHPILVFVLAVMMTPMMYAAIATFFEPIGLPALTFPFILVTWTLLLAGQTPRPSQIR
ncbi:urea transporter [Staphylococcus coagulans]|uniref:Urea transporter n=1 Tax=Staphylococcus coagulans TaxID=74706 RepID=A0ABU1F0E2_9STAP|nr:urea transporter [Staphylococcus coagulans]MDR5603839.1 urea transporter [Staphylococcus coagulans]